MDCEPDHVTLIVLKQGHYHGSSKHLHAQCSIHHPTMVDFSNLQLHERNKTQLLQGNGRS